MVYEIENKNIYKLPPNLATPYQTFDRGSEGLGGLHVFITCVFYKRLMDNYIDL